jgi:short-subunit dehydrogenase
MAVADDIERHYEVTVRILQADLSSPDCAKAIHDATTAAGLCVDILVNNAGLCAHGDFIDGDAIDVSRMLSVNVGAVTALSQLYGRDMKERRRGRILMVSSMSGALPGNPSVAVYAATKAYEKSLASSLGRELER